MDRYNFYNFLLDTIHNSIIQVDTFSYPRIVVFGNDSSNFGEIRYLFNTLINFTSYFPGIEFRISRNVLTNFRKIFRSMRGPSYFSSHLL